MTEGKRESLCLFLNSARYLSWGMSAFIVFLQGEECPERKKNMEFEVFCNKVKGALETHFYGMGQEVDLQLHDIFKNNGVALKGICIMEPGKKVAPNIYLNSYYTMYENGIHFETILDRIVEVHERNRDAEFDLEYFINFDRVRDKIVYKLIHYEQNREMLKNVPHMRYLDMAVVFYCLLSKESEANLSILIRQEHLNMWNVSKADIFKASADNTPKLLGAKIVSMETVVKDCCVKKLASDPEYAFEAEAIMEDMDYLEQTHPSCMFILSNETNLYGAACVLYKNVLKEFAEKLHSNLYVLPSSVHEVILIPTDLESDPEFLADMVKEVNATSIEREEVLSDHVYYYDRETDEMQLCA